MEDCLEDGLITQEEFKKFTQLYRSADDMSSRYLESMYKIKKKGTWKVLGKQK